MALISDGYATPVAVQPYVMTGFILKFLVWPVAILLMVEFAKLRRAGQSWWSRTKGLSLEEVKNLTQWCPRPLLYIALCAAALSMVESFGTGGTHWSSELGFTQENAIGFSLGIATFCSLALPVLASASRMPGRFSDHFRGAQ
jgi:hypothetical protein